MIKLSIAKSSIDDLQSEIDLKVKAINKMTSPEFLEEISKAAFVIIGERFMLATDKFAATNPKAMHHVYEWNRIGRSNSRLFVLNRTSLTGGSFTTQVSFLQSKTKVPIKPELSAAGKNGRSVQRRNVFADKARIMEEGVQINYITKRVQVFSDGFEPKFIAAGTPIHIKNPGGRFVKNSLGIFMQAWYKKNSQPIMNSSGLYERIAEEAAKVLNKNNAGPNEVIKITKQVVNSIVSGRDVIK
jgi:hypothetical protein